MLLDIANVWANARNLGPRDDESARPSSSSKASR
jgi:hypothetical protein